MKSYLFLSLILLLLAVSCKTSEAPLLFDTHQSLPKKIVDEEVDFSFNTYLNSKVYRNPSSNFLKKLGIPRSYIKNSDYKYLISNDVNVVVCFEIIDNKRKSIDGEKLIIGDLVFNSKTLIEENKVYYILEHNLNLDSQSILRVSFFTFQDNISKTKTYTYLEEYSVPIVNSIAIENVKKEIVKIENNIYGYMVDSYERNGNYYQALYYIEKLPDSIKGKLVEPISFYNSFVGNYPNYKLNNVQKVNKDSIYFVPANEHINNIAKDYDYLLFNENHGDPYGRYLLKKLLPQLVKKGFTNLGIETLSYIKHDINKYGYPIHGSGFFTDEPNMANLIREAVKLGIHVFPFEEYSYNCDSCKTSLEKRNFRELGQAQNIILNAKSQKGKTIILSGGGHIYKHSGKNGLKFMAQYLQELTGSRILSINQTFQEEYQIRQEHTMDVIPLTYEGEYYLVDQLEGKVDLQILHSPSIKKDIYTRKIGNDCEVDVKIKSREKGYIALYEKHEKELFPIKSLPMAVIPFGRNSDSIKFNLNNGEYIVLEHNRRGYPINITKFKCE